MKIEKTLQVKLEKPELKILKEASNIIDTICSEYTEYDNDDCKGCPFHNICECGYDNIYIMLTDSIRHIPVTEEE